VQTITRVWADDADAGSVTIQLMSRFRSSTSRQQFALARLLNYSVTPTKPPDPVVEIPKDTTTPKAPTAVTVVDTYVYPEGSGWTAGATCTWLAPTLNTDETPYSDHQHYRVAYRISATQP